MARRGNARATERQRAPARGLGALSLAYAVYGGFWGAWAVVLVEYLALRDLTLAQVGGLFSVTSVTAIATMSLGGATVVQMPRSRALPAAFMVAAASSVAVGLVTGSALAPTFALLGIGIGMVDILVNLAGAEIETATSRPALQVIHAGYGAGGAAGALLAAGATLSGWSPSAVLAAVGGAHLIAAAVLAAYVPDPATDAAAVEASTADVGSTAHLGSTADPGSAAGDPAPSGRLVLGALRRPGLRAAAVIVLCAFFVEGSMDAWSVLFVRTTLGGQVLGAAAAFGAFALAIAAGRLVAARVLFRLGRHRTLVVSGWGSLVAGTAVVVAPNVELAGAAFLVLGMFLSVAAPAALGIAGSGPDAGRAVAAVTAVGYGGFVVGPPVLGWLGDHLGLRTALLALVVTPACMLVVTLADGRRARQSAMTATDEPSR